MTFREIETILMADNWVLISVIDSYHQYRKADAPNAIIVPDYDGRALSIGIIRDLEKKTGLSIRR